MPAPIALKDLAATARYGWMGLVATLAVAVITGCAGLPQDVDRPESNALASPAGTPLGQMVEANRQAAAGRSPSGFLLLGGPQAAYSSRLALVEAAKKTLDLQYYAIHADASTERLLKGVVSAAERGVRVRVLLDDFHSAGRDAQVMRLAFVPNIEMRMFNPLTGARGSTLGRMFSAVADFSRAQQRMHNKLFIADNAMGVTGGRNLGDAYFGTADAGNFVDLDVLAAGPIVQDLSRSFDHYWNNQRAYPVQSLVTREELDTMRSQYEAADVAERERQVALDTTPPPPAASAPAPGQDDPGGVGAQRSRIWDYQPMDLGAVSFVWAPAVVLVDQPAKIPAEGVAAPPSPDAAPASGSNARQAARIAPPAGGVAANGTAALPSTDAADAGEGDTVVDGLLHLMGQARRELLIVSPYFVPGPDMKQAFAQARQRGVRVRVLTNSLASNDAPIAHAGYARHRPELLAMGVELYEMRSELTGLGSAFGSPGGSSGRSGSSPTGSVGSSRAMLHSKLLVMDGRLVAIGSMNLDMRSQKQNTEIALLIRSTELSRRITTRLEPALGELAWRVELQQPGGQLLWHAPQGSGLQDSTTEPDASAPLRLLLQLLGPLAPDHLL
ncbi:phospholipase D family protein [Acidovorax sp. Root217]|uniref:phospholipase D family protein n=1 Tax=Acidovorax sp. Root217 TaxID=1736492 RepID=UPI0009EB24F8